MGGEGLTPWINMDPEAPCSDSEEVEEWRERRWGEKDSSAREGEEQTERGEDDFTLPPWCAARPVGEGQAEKEFGKRLLLLGEVGLCTVL